MMKSKKFFVILHSVIINKVNGKEENKQSF